MASGIHLGFLLICVVRAEHVSRLWDAQAPGSSSQRQNGKYVGFSQQETGQRRLGGSYPQNQFRQASTAPGSAQSNSIHRQTVVGSGYGEGLSNRGRTQPLSQPASSAQQSSYGSPAVSNPSRHTSSYRVNNRRTPKQNISLSTNIASGSSVSKFSKGSKHRGQNDLSGRSQAVLNQGKAWPVPRSTLRTGQYLSSGATSVQSPSRESYSFASTSHQSAAQNKPHRPSAANKTPAYYGQSSAMLFPGNAPRGGFFPSVGDVKASPRLFTGGSQASQQDPLPSGRSSASVKARRVSSRLTAFQTPQKPSPRAYAQTNYNPSHSQANKPHQSHLFSVSGGGNAQGSYKPSYTPKVTKQVSSQSSYGQSAPVLTYRQNAPGLQQPHGARVPTGQGKVSYQPSYTSIAQKQIPNSASSPQASWISRNPTQGARNLPASAQGQAQSGAAGTSGQRFAPTRTHTIPERYGGVAIRRLRDPVETVGKPQPAQPTYTAPLQQRASYTQKTQGLHQTQWKRMRPS